MNRTVTFSITDPSLFWSFQTIDQLTPYTISTDKVLEIEDSYLDTKKRRLFLAGYSCRKRDQDQGVLITLAKLPTSPGKVRTWETRLDKNLLYPIDWPESEVRRRIIKIITNKKLRTIVYLYQIRIVRSIQLGEQKIGRFNLDEITLNMNGQEQHFKQLLIRLQPSTEAPHLEQITERLLEKWPLEIENLSKFEKALHIMQQNNLP